MLRISPATGRVAAAARPTNVPAAANQRPPSNSAACVTCSNGFCLNFSQAPASKPGLFLDPAAEFFYAAPPFVPDGYPMTIDPRFFDKDDEEFFAAFPFIGDKDDQQRKQGQWRLVDLQGNTLLVTHFVDDVQDGFLPPVQKRAICTNQATMRKVNASVCGKN